MSARVRGTVINVHAFGATVRLENGEVLSAPITDVNANRNAYTRAVEAKSNLPFDEHQAGRGRIVTLAKTRIDEQIEASTQAPKLHDDAFEAQITNYLKETEEWESQDVPPAHERHFLRKKKRAAFFESRHSKEL